MRVVADEAFCAIDFGTSNSAVAVGGARGAGGIRLAALEGSEPTMPTAVFYATDGERRYGRAAIAAYVDGHDGRLMRSLKSILGSSLLTETTQLGDGMAVRYLDVVAGFLKQLRAAAEREAGAPVRRVVLGRPVRFVDDDAAADRRAEDALRDAAASIGFDEIAFELEPVAAALDFARAVRASRLVLVADIGGGTSDFSVIRAGGGDTEVLANHGVHVAGTDFDRAVELAAILPSLGYGGQTPEGREVPSRVYHDLATWHLVNGVYAPRRAAELRAMRWFYADAAHHRRLMRVVDARLGHALVARAETAKIALSESTTIAIDLDDVEPGLGATCDRDALAGSLARPLDAIVAAAVETVARARVAAEAIDALYFTGGSTGLSALVDRLSDAFPRAERVSGDRFASVVAGLGFVAERLYGTERA